MVFNRGLGAFLTYRQLLKIFIGTIQDHGLVLLVEVKYLFKTKQKIKKRIKKKKNEAKPDKKQNKHTHPHTPTPPHTNTKTKQNNNNNNNNTPLPTDDAHVNSQDCVFLLSKHHGSMI